MRGSNLGAIVAALLRLLDRYGAAELEAAIGEALNRGVPQALALRHDVVDRVGRKRHGFPAAVVLEPLEHGIAMPEPVHVAGRQLGAEGIVGGEGVPVPRSRCPDLVQ